MNRKLKRIHLERKAPEGLSIATAGAASGPNSRKKRRPVHTRVDA